MIKSMTGFGRGECVGEGRKTEVEIRSVNHRYCDISLRLPRRLSALEGQVRNVVRQRVSRGRVDISVQFEDTSDAEHNLVVDMNLARDYYAGLKGLQEALQIPGEIRLETLASFRELFTRKETETDLEKEWAALEPALDSALNSLDSMRRDEGAKLSADLAGRLQIIGEKAGEVEARVPTVLAAARDRLAQRVQELSGGVELDPARLAQEVAYLAERSDISEELVRLRSHLDQFRDMLERPEPAGRRLEFLLQEMNRETNTIGSKASDALTSQIVVDIKSELEKIREQIQNIE
ncbi:MAG TPA: YicC/YloC family endoribonuclease [Thermodesulfobacteriota bacterium]|nr:YicC/YloC family endoribonuclease [Thermodesulfobacteriota bacterium]